MASNNDLSVAHQPIVTLICIIAGYFFFFFKIDSFVDGNFISRGHLIFISRVKQFQ